MKQDSSQSGTIPNPFSSVNDHFERCIPLKRDLFCAALLFLPGPDVISAGKSFLVDAARPAAAPPHLLVLLGFIIPLSFCHIVFRASHSLARAVASLHISSSLSSSPSLCWSSRPCARLRSTCTPFLALLHHNLLCRNSSFSTEGTSLIAFQHESGDGDADAQGEILVLNYASEETNDCNSKQRMLTIRERTLFSSHFWNNSIKLNYKRLKNDYHETELLFYLRSLS